MKLTVRLLRYGNTVKNVAWRCIPPITSDVDALPNGNRLITSGNVRASGKAGHAKMVEVTYPDNEVVFEADLFFKDALGTKEKNWGQFDIVFRGERYQLITH